MSVPLLFAIGLLLNAAAAILAMRRGAVDAGGAAAGTLVGALIFASGGFLFWAVLIAFFLSSTGMSLYRKIEKEALEQIQEKGSRRDYLQVLANGGVGTTCAILFRITGRPVWAVCFVASLAAANADTWAGELGVLAEKPPVSIITMKRVARGISGGVSLLGFSSAFFGALFIAFVFAAGNLAADLVPARFAALIVPAALAGFLGSLIDSLLGATIQAQYLSAEGGALTEKSKSAGVANRLVRGFAFITNDAVNLASTAAAAAAAGLLFLLFV
jgi:uncharacterized protein (TIGR00297 family)